MITTIINTTIGITIGAIISFLSNRVKNYSKKLKEKDQNNDIQNEALLFLLQSTLTSLFFQYDKNKELYDYQLRGWINMFKIYKKLGGNDFIDELKERIITFRIINTGILSKEVEHGI